MDSNGKLFQNLPEPTDPLLTRYEELVARDFADLHQEQFAAGDLAWLQHIHDKQLEFYKEERRMHFGAFALVGLCFILLFPALLSAEESFLTVAAVETLLFALLVPYTFVYRRYEEGVRRAMRQSIVLENARRLAAR